MKGSVKVYGRLLTYLKPYWKTLVLAIAAAAGVSGLSALLAWMVKPALDDIFIAKKMDMLAILPLAVLIVSLVKGILTYTQSVLMQYVGSRVIMDIRNALYEHIIYLPLRFFGDHSSAQLISRVTNDVGTMQMAIAGRSKDLLRESMTVVGLLFVVFFQKWDLAIISVLVLPLAVYPVISFGRKLRKLSKKWQGKMANVTTVLSETFTGVRIVKAFGMEPIEAERFRKENRDYFDLTIKSVKTAEITSPMMEVIGGLGIAFVMWYGGSQVIKGTTTPGTFFSFLTALLMLYQPFKRLNKAYADIQQAV
ncbi:MAG: ABC transporter transmembrane domain-containing protein, partial [Nitrospirota bacterium]|nr:ABC transporter transmembrane domain-containing protein [Nitrospirota bacterium]